MEPINLLSPKFNGDAVEHSEHSGSAPVRKSINLTFSNLILTEGDETQLKYSFTDSDMHISIGRVSCNIIINNASISKKHGVLAYSKEMNMFYYVDKGSTNGSVVVLKEDDGIRLKGDMRFKLEEVAFRIMELP